jgi:hypothetical protein
MDACAGVGADPRDCLLAALSARPRCAAGNQRRDEQRQQYASDEKHHDQPP